MINPISKWSIFLLANDIGLILVAYILAVWLHIDALYSNIIFLVCALFIYPIVFYIFDFYHPYKRFKRYQTLLDVIFSVFLGSSVLAAASYTDRTLLMSRFVFLYMAIFLILLVYPSRIIADYVFKRRLFLKRSIVLGTGPYAVETVKMIQSTAYSGMQILGFIKAGETGGLKKVRGVPVLGTTKSLSRILDSHSVDMMILALEPYEESLVRDSLGAAFKKDIVITSAVQLFENIQQEIPYRLLSQHFLVSLRTQVNRKPYLKIKRMLDMASSLFLMLFLFPILFLASVPILIMDKQNPIYVQIRIGKNGKPFNLFKLKTMKVRKKGKLTATVVGKWLRRYRIDEIPQLINVLLGDMSLVGPRPEIEYFVERSKKGIPFYETVFAVKPGLTGWAQVKFRHATSKKDYEHKFRYNLYYLKNISFALDLFVLLKTVKVVVLGGGK